MKNLPENVQIVDVCCRDGFQMEKKFIATERKIEIINSLSQLGFKKLEITSFVSPKAIPQMKDASQVVSGISRSKGIIYSALVPNLKGAEKAAEVGIDEINVVISVSEKHNLANIRMTPQESVERLRAITSLAVKLNLKVNVSLATAFGCPFTGRVSPDTVLSMVDKVLSLGVTSITFADTTGMANPVQVYRLMRQILIHYPKVKVTLHFHNTRGMGMANILAGLEAGVATFDASLGGLGGCPFAPGATGNVATEDVVNMLEEMGIKTGIDLEGLIAAARNLEEIIGRTLPGQVIKSGRVCNLHPLPAV